MKTAIALLLLGLAGCSSLPGLKNPRISLVPQLTLLELTGDTRMQSPSGGGNVDNPEIDFSELGVSDRDDEFGGMVRAGDGFSGLDIGYLQFDLKSSKQGTLSENWGNLLAGDVVRTTVTGYELRARFIAQLAEWELAEDTSLQVGIGPAISHRKFKFRTNESSGVRSQRLVISDDGVPMAAARVRIGYREFAAQADYAISPDLNFGGDFDGPLQDLELTLSYTFEDQDFTVTAGYRREMFEASGDLNTLRYDLDFGFNGYVFGAEVRF